MTFIFTSCTNEPDKIKINWTTISYLEIKMDSCFLVEENIEDAIKFKYFYGQDSIPLFIEFDLLEDDNLVIYSTDTINVYDKFKLKYKSDSIDIIKYEFPDNAPGGMGYWIFSREIGLMGFGFHQGDKTLITKRDNEVFNPEIIAKLIAKEKKMNPPPPVINMTK